MSRTLLVWGEKEFQVEVPDDAKVTFGPFSPPPTGGYVRGGGSPVGTLRIYKGTKATENVVAVFSGVAGFRDESLGYAERPSVTAKKAEHYFSYEEMSDDDKADLAGLIAGQLAERALDEHNKEDDDDDGTTVPF